MAIVCTIDATGIQAPALADIRAYFVAAYQGIYGEDVYLESDSQDGELLDLFAAAVHDANAMAVSVFNAFSPSSAQGEGLSRVVKINGIRRRASTFSTVDLLIGGTAGTIITNGIASDTAGGRWVLPETVTIPVEGQTTVSATAAATGDVSALPDTVTGIATPTRGWQTVTNPLAAVPGDPVELDATLRRRQAISTMIPSHTILEGIMGAVAALTGVTRSDGVENDTDTTDANGLPSHSISVVAEGGDPVAIAAAIFLKKGPGVGTYGTTSEVIVDSFGVSRTVNFMRPTAVPISGVITIKALAGYTTNIGALILQAVADYVNALAIGDPVYLTKLYVPANLSGPNGLTFDITGLTIARDGGSPTAANIVLTYHEAATCDVSDLSIVVT